MHHVRNAMTAAGGEGALRRVDVVASELRRVVTADLSLQHHGCRSVTDTILPNTGVSHVGKHCFDIRVQPLENGQVGRMLVDHENPAKSFRLEQDDEILADEARASQQHDPRRFFHWQWRRRILLHQIDIRLKMASGSARINRIIHRQYHGV